MGTSAVGARLRRAREVGSGTLEYIAAIALAGLLIGATVLPVRTAAPVAREKICAVLAALDVAAGCAGGTTDPGGGGGTTTDPTFDPKPTRCKIGEHGEQVNAEIKVAFITFGQNAGFIETTYSDGTVTYTATDGASVGLEGGVGGKLDIGKVERGAKVDFGGDFKVDYGSTWYFKDADEAAAMRKQLDDYLTEQEIIKNDPYYSIKFIWSDPKEPPKPPQQTVSTIKLEGSASGSVGLSLPWKQDPDAKSGLPNLTLADAGIKFGGSGTWTQITDSVLHTTTYTTSGEAYGQVNGTVGPYSGELKGVLGSSMAVTRDKDNQVVRVTLVTTREGKATGTTTYGGKGQGASDGDGAGNLTVQTATLNVTTPQQRALVDSWLSEQASDPNAFVSPETYYPDRMVPGDPFQNLMYTNATVSNVSYDNVTDKEGFAAEVKLGIQLGVDFSLETNDTRATSASYLDVPGADGVRPPTDFPGCVSK